MLRHVFTPIGAYSITQCCRQDKHTNDSIKYQNSRGKVKVQGGVELKEGFGEEVTFELERISKMTKVEIRSGHTQTHTHTPHPEAKP